MKEESRTMDDGQLRCYTFAMVSRGKADVLLNATTVLS